MMTYSEIKSKYPLGCEVRLNKMCHPALQNYEGKLLAILDPSKHGPKCLLFKIEKPEGRKISREKAIQTVKRKVRCNHTGHEWTVGGGEVWKNFALSVLNKTTPPNSYGLLKWLTPSEVKERVAKGYELKTEQPSMESPKPNTMDRTEQLKNILKPGMKVKLGRTAPSKNVGFVNSMRHDLDKWVTIKQSEWYDTLFDSFGRFFAEGNYGSWWWPLTMIEKVEGEYDERDPYEEKFGISMDSERSDTIPVPRDKVKEEVEKVYNSNLSHGANGVVMLILKNTFGDELIDTLLQEIEEEEKYFQLPGGEVKNEKGNVIADIASDRITPICDVCVPEIHKEGGQYVVKFKKNK